MRAEPMESRVSGQGDLSPMKVAHHPLFTAREKIEMLEEMRAGFSNFHLDDDDLGFEAGEIDDAIEEVRLNAQNGDGSEMTRERGDD